MSSRMLVAVLAATTMLAGSAAFADQQSSDQQATTPPPGHAAMIKDFDKLSTDGARAYQDLTLARLAIFDGRAADAKKYVDDADTGFNNAKNDESVFKQDESSMKSKMGKADGSMASNGDNGSQASGGSASNHNSANAGSGKQVDYLPVDGAVSINEDFTAKPKKAKAVQDANKSLAQGDKNGAMEKLKLAGVETSVTLAVVPLQQTIDNVNQAKQLIDAGKFYEGSQKLRAVQNATVITVADMSGAPKGQGSQGNAPASTTR